MIETVDMHDGQIIRRAIVDAPVEELFDLVANPHRHHELDGGGSVREIQSGSERMVEGEPFTIAMRMFGLPYKMTSTPTRVVENELVEWQTGAGQKWRWEFKTLDDHRTEVTEAWDPREMPAQPIARLIGKVIGNAKGIEGTLQKLQDRYR